MKFYRCDKAREHPDRGSGLGLAIVANAVKQMKGTVEAKNGDAGGLVITITLPVCAG